MDTSGYIDTSDYLFDVKTEVTAGVQSILIEIDEPLLRFLATLELGSLLSLSELLSLATKYDCEHCEETFYSGSLFKEHLSSSHVQKTDAIEDEDEKKIAVAVAEDKHDSVDFNNSFVGHQVDDKPDEINITKKTKSGKRKFECDICGKIYVSRGAYDKHNLSHKVKIKDDNSEGPFECGEFNCTKVFDNMKLLTVHRNQHKRRLKKRKGNRGAYSYRTYDEDKKEFCPICKFCIPPHYTLERHRILKHDVVKKCAHCDLTFDTADDLKSHERKQHYQLFFYEKVNCDICGVELKSKYLINYHKRMVHGTESERKKDVCEACGKGFTSKKKLDLHKMKYHGGKKEFICTINGCNQAYWEDRHLRRHIDSVHLNIRPFSCELCGASFSSGDLLRRHKSIHSEERTCICPFCGKGFKQPSTLYRHKISCNLNPDKH